MIYLGREINPMHNNHEQQILWRKIRSSCEILINTKEPSILVITSGIIHYQIENILQCKQLSAIHAVPIAANREITLAAVEGASYLLFTLNKPIQALIDQTLLKDQKREAPIGVNPGILPLPDSMRGMLESLSDYVKNNWGDKEYLEVKTLELLKLIKHYCGDLAFIKFYTALYNCCSRFAEEFIYYYSQSLTIAEIAEHMNYSVSGFGRKFRLEFNMAPSDWIREHRSEKILQSIINSDTNYTDLALRFGFSSHSSFSSYVKKHFGRSPGDIRKAIRYNKISARSININNKELIAI